MNQCSTKTEPLTTCARINIDHVGHMLAWQLSLLAFGWLFWTNGSQPPRSTSLAHMCRMTWSHILSMLGRRFTSHKEEAAFQENGILRFPYHLCDGLHLQSLHWDDFARISVAILANKPNLPYMRVICNCWCRSFVVLGSDLSWTKSALSNTWHGFAQKRVMPQSFLYIFQIWS